MRERSFAADTKDQPFDEVILQQGELISDRLNMLRQEQYPPDAQKVYVSFHWPKLPTISA